MLTDRDAEDAADWLLKNAEEFGRVRAERIYAEEYLRSLRALIASESNATSEAARDREALASPRYTAQLVLVRDAVREDEIARARRVAAEMRIEVWRTQAANQRGRI